MNIKDAMTFPLLSRLLKTKCCDPCCTDILKEIKKYDTLRGKNE